MGRWQGRNFGFLPAADLSANGSLHQRSSTYSRRPVERLNLASSAEPERAGGSYETAERSGHR